MPVVLYMPPTEGTPLVVLSWIKLTLPFEEAIVILPALILFESVFFVESADLTWEFLIVTPSLPSIVKLPYPISYDWALLSSFVVWTFESEMFTVPFDVIWILPFVPVSVALYSLPATVVSVPNNFLE